MVKKSINVFFLITCSLFTTFFYQNCSEIENTSVVGGQVEYLPLFTNQLKLFEATSEIQQPTNRCRNMHEVLFSKEHNLCFEVNDSCAFATLAENGFKPVIQNLGRKLQITEPIVITRSQSSVSDSTGEAELSSLEKTQTTEPEETDLKALIENCQLFVDINDLKPVDFKVVTAAQAGYQANPDLMCSQALESLVNFKTRTCLTATDGCESNYLKKQGFVRDFYSMCPQSL